LSVPCFINLKTFSELERVEVRTVSTTHLRLTAAMTKSAFCALHG